ncbi:MAG TPA: hypothetical protein VFX07_09405 [Candidatus Udaeobacter sp.]|nr:hypothetical protein [Candidatus Udaeobacter sp.]
MKTKIILISAFLAIVIMPATSNAENPTAIATTTNVTAPGGTSYSFTVRYSDDGAIDVGTLDNNDVRVSGPGGFNVAAAFVSVDVNTNGTPRIATYSIAAPGGSWDFADNGTYNVVMQAFQVFDGVGHSVAAGNIGSFTVMVATQTGPPFVTTKSGTNVASFSSRLNGSVDPHGLTTIVYFQYGATTRYGLTTPIQSKTGNTYQNVTANIGNLTASTTYHFRIAATNSSGTRYGSDKTFTTLSVTGLPVAITNPATNVTSSSVTLKGSVDPHGLTTNVHFQYGTTTSYGHITANQGKTGNVYQNVAANISSLNSQTTYHFRIVATNSRGTRYGSDRTFTTP